LEQRSFWECQRINELDTGDDESEIEESVRVGKRSLLGEFNINLLKQEAIVHLKARQKWLKHGDLNTKCFHFAVRWRRARNEFHGVDINGRWCKDKDVIKEKVIEFFKLDLSRMTLPSSYWTTLVSILFQERIMKCWSVVLSKKKSGKLFGAVIVQRVLTQMVLILGSLSFTGMLLKRMWCPR